MSVDLNLPTFGLDCREWLVAAEADGLLPDDQDTAVVAVLSTAIIDGADLLSAQAVFTLALIDDEAMMPTRASAPFAREADTFGSDGFGHGEADGFSSDGLDLGDICVLDVEWAAGYARFAVPVPGGELAIVAEFTSAPYPRRELVDRFYDLVTSFRWTA